MYPDGTRHFTRNAAFEMPSVEEMLAAGDALFQSQVTDMKGRGVNGGGVNGPSVGSSPGGSTVISNAQSTGTGVQSASHVSQASHASHASHGSGAHDAVQALNQDDTQASRGRLDSGARNEYEYEARDHFDISLPQSSAAGLNNGIMSIDKPKPVLLSAFQYALLTSLDLPSTWTSITMEPDGTITAFGEVSVPVSNPKPVVVEGKAGRKSPRKRRSVDLKAAEKPVEYVMKMSSIKLSLNALRSTEIDAQTSNKVKTFADGRLAILYTDQQVEMIFPDRTSISTHSSGNSIFIQKKIPVLRPLAGSQNTHNIEDSTALPETRWLWKELPSVEIDVDIDYVCRDHASGIKTPINKGGDRVRSRISLTDGSAMMIKYNTSITTQTNGSIKFVCKDRTAILALDSGEVRCVTCFAYRNAYLYMHTCIITWCIYVCICVHGLKSFIPLVY